MSILDWGNIEIIEVVVPKPPPDQEGEK